ncbi:hypothetical protein ACROYT_G025930 [Oculina patagonica]
MFNKGGPGKQRGFGFGGFALAAKKEDPVPKNMGRGIPLSKPVGNIKKNQPSQKCVSSFPLPGARKPIFVDSDNEDDETKFVDDDDEDDDSMPANWQAENDDDDDEEDELDKFMAGIEHEVQKETAMSEKEKSEKDKKKIRRDDIEEEDDHESYFNYVKNAPVVAYPDDEEEIEYDSDGNPIAPEKSKIIVPLPAVDHFEIDYPTFEKNFYFEHEEIAKLTEHEVQDLRKKLGMKVSGALPSRPSISFAHFGFDEQLMGAIRKSDYTQPTPIQCQAIPIALSGRDIIGIAKTGSGKTAAFLWPALVHIMDQPELEPGDGPIALICAPTRELCQQIFAEARRFGRVYNIHAVAVFGGGNKYEQSKALQEGAEIVVATPGRLIDHIKGKGTNLQRVTYLVFDEADRMFDMGFEPQVRSIANNVRPDRQTLLFSATFKKKVEMLCRDILTDPIRVVVGELGEANEDVTQIVEILPSVSDKWTWLTRHLVSFTSAGSVLIFVTKKANSEELAAKLKTKDFEVVLLHGDMDQFERNKVINAFKKQEIAILVATDVAARGLDIPSIKTVINYDVARDIHTHTHRIGRTGRAGEKGAAYTLLTSADQNFSGDLVRNLEGANQAVSEALMDMAMKNAWFRKSRFRHGKGKASVREGRPRMRERPGLGMHGSSDTQVGDGRGAQYSYPDSSYPQSSSVSSSSSKSSFRPASSSSSGGVFGSSARNDRTSALKAAFQAQYKTHFCAAASSTSNTWDASSHHSTAKPPDRPKASKPPVKKSRWDPA